MAGEPTHGDLGQSSARSVGIVTASTACVLVFAAFRAPAADSPPSGLRAALEAPASSVLVDCYEGWLRDQDIERFRRQVAARYTEKSLARILESAPTETSRMPRPDAAPRAPGGAADSRSTQARRAAVLALGLFGTYEASNAVVARGLRDSDDTVRELAESALWSIWFRADTPENNESLQRVVRTLKERQPEDAIEQATKLCNRAPKFAEAYNQRAIAHFVLGHFDESAADCQKVLELNPYHIGALGGLAQCQMGLNKPDEALKTLRRSLKLQPFNEGLRKAVAFLEAQGN